jgi:hypothetical protein
MLRPSPVDAEIYRAPSSEAWRLVRRASWLTSPERGQSRAMGRLGLHFLIAPMTQLTFISFDLQAFLFVVFHRRLGSVLGHGIFMTTENLFLMAALRGVRVVELPFGVVDGGMLHALLLLAWYGAMAAQARLRLWFAVTAPIVLALYAASGPLARACHESLGIAPAWGALASAFLVAVSHAAEPDLPPRTVDSWRWVPLRQHLLEPGIGPGARVLRMLHVVLLAITGTIAEAWASLRLMPYNWLLVMMRLGYAPARYAQIVEWRDRAWATGNPALDYVGTGGGTFLARPGDGDTRSNEARSFGSSS